MEKTAQKRCVNLCLILVVGLSALSVRLVMLQTTDREGGSGKAGKSYERTYPLLAKRGTIVDCNGEIMAKSAISQTLIVDKYHLRDPRTVAKGIARRELGNDPKWVEWDDKTRNRKVKLMGRKLLLKEYGAKWYVNEHLDYACSEIAPALGLTKDELKKLINVKKLGDKVIAKDISPDIASRIKELIDEKNIKGFRFDEDMKRTYCSPTAFTHLMGSTGMTKASNVERGISGVERAYDEHLKGRHGFKKEMRDRSGEIMPAYEGSTLAPINGNVVQLTIDMGIQTIVEEQLDLAVKEYDPVRATIIIMDPNTGDILAFASRPHFNLSTRKGIVEFGFNFGLQGSYEPGSTFKMVAVAAALDLRLKRLDDKIFCHNGYYRNTNPKFTVRDDYPKEYLKVWEIPQKSNNIGTYMLAKMVGYDRYMNYARGFGFGIPTDLGVGSESKGKLPKKFNAVDFSRNSYGYALTVTPLQIANFYSVMANGGKLMKPRLIKKVDNYMGETVMEFKPEVVRRVISERAARDCRTALETVVQKGGTATRADVPGYTEGGKTGTAEKWDPELGELYLHERSGKMRKRGAYSKTKKTVSFAGMLPIDKPEFVCVVVVEEPRAEKDFNFGGGTVAAPIWRETMKQVAAYRNITPSEELESELGKR